MKKNYSIEEKIAVEEGLKALLIYNKAMRFSLNGTYIDVDVLSEYFLSDDRQFCIDCEKKIGAAAIRYCYDNPDILQKEKNARLMCCQMLEAVRGAKIEAEYNMGKYGVGKIAEAERERRKRENFVVQKAVFIEKAKKTLLKTPLNAAKSGIVKFVITPSIVSALLSHGVISASTVTALGLSVSIPYVVGVAVFAGMGIAYEAASRLIPPRVKEKMKAKGREMMEKAANVIERNLERFEHTEVGQRVSSFVREKVEPIVSKGAEMVNAAYDKVKAKATSMWTKFKSLF